MFRQESCHASTVKQSEERACREPAVPSSLVHRPFWAQRVPFRAVLGAKAPVQSHLGRRKTCPEAVLAARRSVRRPSWRSKARPEVVLGARRPIQKPSWAPGDPSGGRLGRKNKKPRNQETKKPKKQKNKKTKKQKNIKTEKQKNKTEKQKNK